MTTMDLERRRFTVEEYHQMGRAGILDEDERVELLEGEIIPRSPIGNPHAVCVRRLTHIFMQRLVGRVVVNIQNPVRLGRSSEPEPDVSLLRFREDLYSDRTPRGSDALLIVEVADSSPRRDRKKLSLYARHGVPEVWIVNLDGECVEVYREPLVDADRYRTSLSLEREERLSPQAFPDLELRVEEILGSTPASGSSALTPLPPLPQAVEGEKQPVLGAPPLPFTGEGVGGEGA